MKKYLDYETIISIRPCKLRRNKTKQNKTKQNKTK